MRIKAASLEALKPSITYDKKCGLFNPINVGNYDGDNDDDDHSDVDDNDDDDDHDNV